MTQESDAPGDKMQAEWRALILGEVRSIKQDVKDAPRAQDLRDLRAHVDEKVRHLEATVKELTDEVHAMAKTVSVLTDRNLRASMIWGAVTGSVASLIFGAVLGGCRTAPALPTEGSGNVLPPVDETPDAGTADVVEAPATEGSVEAPATEGSAEVDAAR